MKRLETAQVSREKIPVILNQSSGLGHSADGIASLEQAFADAGLDAQILPACAGDELPKLIRQALTKRPRVIAAGGGDGTLNAVADVLRGTDTALGVLPIGTLNHFARDLGIPLDIAEAVQAIARGRRVAVDVGEVNGRCFLNNASLGLYPDIVRERTRQQRRLGLSKRLAMIWATLTALDRSRLLDLRLQVAEREHTCRAPFVFVGNNQYNIEGFDLGTRARLDEGRLSIYTAQRCSPGGLLVLALRALFGRLKQAEDFTALSAMALRVETRRKRMLVATDGEVTQMESPFEFRILPRSLQVIVP